MKKVIVGLSGGVDSAVAMYILKETGYDVIGVSMKIWSGEINLEKIKKGGCYGPNEENELKDAEKVCKILNVPHFIFDLSEEYRKEVLDYVIREYKSGRTPNPCVWCNWKIKFKILPLIAKTKGIDFNFFATGHYAIIKNENDKFVLKKGKDKKKDQSYFLWKLTKEQIKNTIFPLGEMEKYEVKNIARKLNFPMVEKPESQDFFEGDIKFLIPENKKGPIKDLSGNILGEHEGISHYTIGQRRGLGISSTKPLYVLKISPQENTIYVGEKEKLFKKKFKVSSLNWISIDEPQKEITCFVKIRYKHEEAKAILKPLNKNEMEIEFFEPQLSITPGQSAVFYDGDVLLGGGIIDEVYD